MQTENPPNITPNTTEPSSGVIKIVAVLLGVMTLLSVGMLFSWNWTKWCGTLKRVVWYFEEGGVVLWRGWCGTLKRVVRYFEEGGVVIWRWRVRVIKTVAVLLGVMTLLSVGMCNIVFFTLLLLNSCFYIFVVHVWFYNIFIKCVCAVTYLNRSAILKWSWVQQSRLASYLLCSPQNTYASV